MFICQLSEHEQNEIRKAIEEHARLNGYELELDIETDDYIAMSGRICDIEEILK